MSLCAWRLKGDDEYMRAERLNKENIPSRAYIAFKDEEILAVFSREYDGHLFRDKAGASSICESTCLEDVDRLWACSRKRVHRGRRVCSVSEGPE